MRIIYKQGRARVGWLELIHWWGGHGNLTRKKAKKKIGSDLAAAVGLTSRRLLIIIDEMVYVVSLDRVSRAAAYDAMRAAHKHAQSQIEHKNTQELAITMAHHSVMPMLDRVDKRKNVCASVWLV